MTSNTPKVQENPSKPRQKVKLEDVEVSKKDNKGVSFLSGVLLIVLIVAAIFSFSIVAIELGEIKRLWGLKETTEKQIVENNQIINGLKLEIDEIKQTKLREEEKLLKARAGAKQESSLYERWKEVREENEAKAKLAKKSEEQSMAEKDRLVKESEIELSKIKKLTTEKNLLEVEINEFKEIKSNLDKHKALLEKSKSDLETVTKEVTENRAESAVIQKNKEYAEEMEIKLTANIEGLDSKRTQLLADVSRAEQTLKTARKDLDIIKREVSTIKGELNAKTEEKSQLEQSLDQLNRDYSQQLKRAKQLDDWIKKASANLRSNQN